MNTLLRIIIIEDEESAVRRLQKELMRLEGYRFEVLAFIDSVTDAVEWFSAGNEVDLIFMDIHLSDGQSFEIFKQLEVPAPVIFTTAYDEYAIKAFKVNSLDYLLKPIVPEELEAAVGKFIHQRNQEPGAIYLEQLKELTRSFSQPEPHRSSFLVSYRHKMIMIDVHEVAYIFVREKAVFIRKNDGREYPVDYFLDEMENQLDPREFYRANRQYLVARSSIAEIEPYFNGRLLLRLRPEAPSPVTVSKEKASHFKRWADS